MNHRKGYKKLGRTSSHRKALLRNLAISLFDKGRIKTNLSVSKELRRTVEGLITLGKRGNYDRVANLIKDKKCFKKILEIVPRYEERSGGYTRIIKLGRRKGDGALISMIELID